MIISLAVSSLPMRSDEVRGRPVPSLVYLCQRVASAHIDSITTLGSDIAFDLAKPILERCSAEQLLQIEDSSPHLQSETHDLWMNICCHRYPKMAYRYLEGEEHDPETWKERYLVMQEVEARRLEELGSRLRSQRQEADERKKEREIKVTDSLPLPKRSKTGWSTPQPKTLFQKTRSETSRIQRTMYSARVVPPMPVAKNYAQCTKPTFSILPPPPSPQADGQLSRVTVNTVKRLASSSTSHKPPLQPPLPTLASSEKPALGCDIRLTKPPPWSACAVAGSSAEKSPQPVAPPHSGDLPPRKTAKSPKKDPMACLFLPKQRVRPTKV